MTNREPDLDLDELASATLDGEAGAADARRVVADERLARRIDEFAAVRDALREPVPSLPSDRREALLVEVLDAAGPTPRRPRAALGLATAAAIIAVAFLAGSIALLDRDGGDGFDTAQTVQDLDRSTDGLMTESSAGDQPEAALDGEHLPGELADLGAFVDLDELRARLAGGQPIVTSPEQAKGAVACLPASPSPYRSLGTSAGTLYAATVDGSPVVVVVETTSVTVLEAGTCTVVDSFTR